jgi:hypothetical protein
VPVTVDEKLSALTERFKLTSDEIAVAAACTPRAIELRRTRASRGGADRRRASRLDHGIDALYSVLSLLVDRCEVDVALARAFVLGLSAYLEEQTPLAMLGADEFELVREAALAFSAAQPPVDFIEDHGPIPRVARHHQLAAV